MTLSLFVVADADVAAGRGERIPGNMEPVGAREELVGEGVGLEEVDQALELSRIFGADVSSLTNQVLGVAHTADFAIDGLITEPRVDNNWPNDGSCGF